MHKHALGDVPSDRTCRCEHHAVGTAHAGRAGTHYACVKPVSPSWQGLQAHGVCMRQANEVLLEGRPALGYDVLSLDVGITPSGQGVPGALEHTTPVKPVSTCARFFQIKCGLPAVC